MLNYVLEHPWLLALILPTILASIPSYLVKAEKAVLAKLFAYGDANDKEAIRASVKIWVLWAEKKYNITGQGKVRFQAVSAIIGRALPFIPQEQLEDLIEKAVMEMDAAANAAVQAVPLPPAP